MQVDLAATVAFLGDKVDEGVLILGVGALEALEGIRAVTRPRERREQLQQGGVVAKLERELRLLRLGRVYVAVFEAVVGEDDRVTLRGHTPIVDLWLGYAMQALCELIHLQTSTQLEVIRVHRDGVTRVIGCTWEAPRLLSSGNVGNQVLNLALLLDREGRLSHELLPLVLEKFEKCFADLH